MTQTVNEKIESKLEEQERKIGSLESAAKKAKAMSALLVFGSGVLGVVAGAAGVYLKLSNELEIWERLKDAHVRSESGSDIFDHRNVEIPSVQDIAAELDLPEWDSFALKTDLPDTAALVPPGSTICFFGKDVPEGWDLAGSSEKWPDEAWLQTGLHNVALPNINGGAYLAGTKDLDEVGSVREPNPVSIAPRSIPSNGGSIALSAPSQGISFSDRTVQFVRSGGEVERQGILSTSSENYGVINHSTENTSISFTDNRATSIAIPGQDITLSPKNMPTTVLCRWIIRTQG